MEGEVAYRPTEDLSVAMARDWYFDVLRRPRTGVKMFLCLCLFAVMFAAINWYFEGSSQAASGAGEGLLWGAATIVIIWALSYLLLPLRIRRLFRQHRVREGAQTWRWSAEGIAVATPNGEVRYAWSELHRVVAGRRAFLLYFNDRHYIGLPREVLDDDQFRSFGRAVSHHRPAQSLVGRRAAS